MNSVVRLNKNRMKEIPFDNYEKDFIFFVNGEAFPTCRILADLLSPKICQLNFTDPTSKEYYITTKHSGNFQHIINLINFEKQNINDDEIPFINEILSILNNQYIKIQIPESEINLTNSLELLNKYHRYGISYTSQINHCIDFISTNFDKIIQQSQKKLINLDQNLIEKVLSKEKLQLESEDQLLNLINLLYKKDKSNSYLYKYVCFENVSNPTICEFLNIFNYNDLDGEIWSKISMKIKQENYMSFIKKTKRIRGIFNYLQNLDQLKSEIILTNSPIYMSNCESAKNLFLFDDNSKYFQSISDKNAFICFEFKSKQFIPTSYRIKTTSLNYYTPKNRVIEASNDKKNWEIIDNQSNASLKDNNNWWEFDVKNPDMKIYKYLKMRQTGENSAHCHYLTVNSIDFDGFLIDKSDFQFDHCNNKFLKTN